MTAQMARLDRLVLLVLRANLVRMVQKVLLALRARQALRVLLEK